MSSLAKVLIRLGTSLIPVQRIRKRIRRRLLDHERDAWLAKVIPVVRGRYAEHARRCREKLIRGERLRVCFLVCDVSMFSAEPVYQKMLRDSRFEPFIAVAPRISRGEDFLRETQAKTLEVLSARYGKIVQLYDPDTKNRLSLTGCADIVFTSIVYGDQTFHEYTSEPLSEQALVTCITYSYNGLLRANVDWAIFKPEIALMWRYFVPNPQTLALWTKTNPLLSWNARVSGYAKMDRLATIPVRTNRQKTVIIAPHHSLPKGAGENGGMTLSTFLQYADLFRRLPREYPEIHFVFRPHPLLFPRLATEAWWGAQATSDYRAALEAEPNVEFQQGGDYFETFANSDGLIHDCGSFLAEYFYTGRPQCYLLADAQTEEREFLPFGRELLNLTYKAYDEQAIRAFLENVVLGGEDPKKPSRDARAASDICCFYPRAADRVIVEVVESLQRAHES